MSSGFSIHVSRAGMIITVLLIIIVTSKWVTLLYYTDCRKVQSIKVEKLALTISEELEESIKSAGSECIVT